MNIPTKSFMVRTKSGTYPFIVGVDLERELLNAIRKEGERRIAIIADTTSAKLFGKKFLTLLKKEGDASLFTFTGGEHNKNQKAVTDLQHKMLKERFGRDTIVIALGGGIVGDVAGLVAATYVRGVPYIQVPTTTLAMVDSSVGGKVGVDTPYGKNTIGAFHQPRAVIADLRFLESLSREHVINGLLEAIKKFITSDKRMLTLVEQIDLDDPLTTARVLQEVILKSVQGKARVVAADEHEKNERKVLNFGHTIGHALELLSGYRLLHGKAIALGMLVEVKISELLGLLPHEEAAYIEDYLATFGIRKAGLKKFPIGKIIDTTKTDKKTRGGKAHYVLLRRVGQVYVKDGSYAHVVEDAVVEKALRELTT